MADRFTSIHTFVSNQRKANKLKERQYNDRSKVPYTRFYVLLRVFFWTYIFAEGNVECPHNRLCFCFKKIL